MSNFSVNQVHQMYVAESLSESSHESTVTSASNAKAIGVNTYGAGNDKQFAFIYKGADTVLTSDLIPVKNLDRVEVFKADALGTKMRKVKVVLDSTINSGNPVAGQDYILGIQFKNFFSAGDDSTYYKDAAVHVTSAMEADKKEFYKAMVAALNMAFSREDGATATSNPYLAFSAGTAGSEDGIYIEEKPQEWQLGTKKARRIMFDVFPSLIYTGGDDVIWGTSSDLTPTTTVGDGQKIADLEWFCMGERGDQYRNVGWPNVIPTTYMVDPTKNYSLIELHYAFTDTGVNSYRTEKEITIAVPDGTGASKYTVINGIIDEIENATGLTIAGLAD